MKDSKIIVLTGASRGLGLALATEFAALGHTVVGCARSSEAIDELSQRFVSPHRFDAVDICSDVAVKSWADSVLAQFGSIDYLINNAATINHNAPLWQVSHADMSNLMNTNVVAVASMIRHFVPGMIDSNSGIVINLSSGWGRSASAEVAPYCASKWAIEGMTKALAEELPAGMAAIPLNPGIINTDMLQSCFGDAASDHQDPKTWGKKAAPYILSLSPSDSGQSLSVP